jgi:hypothetical protein
MKACMFLCVLQACSLLFSSAAGCYVGSCVAAVQQVDSGQLLLQRARERKRVG